MDGYRHGAAFTFGTTLLEMMVTLSVASVLLAVAVPALSDMIFASRLRGAADNLAAQLRFAMTESIKRNRAISVTFRSTEDGRSWCYGMSEDSGCDCGVAGSCVYDGVERLSQGTEYSGIQIAVSVAQGRFSFQPKRNTVTAGSITFTAANGKSLRTVVSGYGRIRHCSPAGEAFLQGYPAC